MFSNSAFVSSKKVHSVRSTHRGTGRQMIRSADWLHATLVQDTRAARLAACIAPLVRPGWSVLDIGCGDGTLAQYIARRIHDVTIRGVEVRIRPGTKIPVQHFDGVHLPYPDDAFDAALIVDVLHHTEEPKALMREAARVTRKAIIIKDHRRNGVLAAETLHFMDRVGNDRFGVPVLGNYWSESEWRSAFVELGLTVVSWTTRVRLYPRWASWVFGRGLHFVAKLEYRTRA